MSGQIPEHVYYARHFRLPGFSQATQDRLKRGRVLIVGVGGLGCPVAMYLAGAGVGTIALCDGDTVSATNLHRQVLFNPEDVGSKKAEIAAQRLKRANPHVEAVPIPRFGDADLLRSIAPTFDVVVDGTDNFDAKFEINDACADAGVPVVYGSIFQYEGQVSVFNLGDAAQRYTYRDLYPEPPPQSLRQNCGEAGVIGVLPGIVGTVQANEVVKMLTGLGTPLSGSLLTFDALSGEWRKLAIKRRAGEEKTSGHRARGGVEEIDYEGLLEKLKQPVAPVVVDVRESDEREKTSIGGIHIPLGRLPESLHMLPTEGEVVLYCRSGHRSARAQLYLQAALPRLRVLNLVGGVEGCAGATCFS